MENRNGLLFRPLKSCSRPQLNARVRHTVLPMSLQLCKTLAAAGLAFNDDAQVAAIQCKPGIGYGEEPCTCDETLAAHRTSLGW